MTKKTKISVSVAVAFVAITGASVGVYNHFKLWQFKGVKTAYLQNYMQNPKCDFNPLVNPNLTNKDSQFIAHAGGALIDDKTGEVFTYTNSKEALLQSIKEGFKFIELDLSLDSQGEIFAAHDYKHFYTITNAQLVHFLNDSAFAPPSKDYIKNAKIYGRFTPLHCRI